MEPILVMLRRVPSGVKEYMVNTLNVVERRDWNKLKSCIEKALLQRLKAKENDLTYWLDVDIYKERLSRMI